MSVVATWTLSNLRMKNHIEEREREGVGQGEEETRRRLERKLLVREIREEWRVGSRVYGGGGWWWGLWLEFDRGWISGRI